jgi:DNA-binding NtrC family response regulator
VAPLRERRDDVLPLARRFLERFAAEATRPLRLGPEAEAALVAHDWPGNVRELENAIERAAVLARGEVAGPEDLLLEPRRESGGRSSAGGTLQEAIERASAERLRAAIAECGGNRAEAARVLAIDRTTLYRLMKRLGVDPEA